jgi:hypothetical protein
MMQYSIKNSQMRILIIALIPLFLNCNGNGDNKDISKRDTVYKNNQIDTGFIVFKYTGDQNRPVKAIVISNTDWDSIKDKKNVKDIGDTFYSFFKVKDSLFSDVVNYIEKDSTLINGRYDGPVYIISIEEGHALKAFTILEYDKLLCALSNNISFFKKQQEGGEIAKSFETVLKSIKYIIEPAP